MSNIYQIREYTRSKQENLRLEQASEWVARLDRELTVSERQDFHLWLAIDIENAKTLMEMAKIWDKMDELMSLFELLPYPNVLLNRKKNSESGLWRFSTYFSLVGFLFVGWFCLY